MCKLERESTTKLIGLKYHQNIFEAEEIRDLEKDLNQYGIELQTQSNAIQYIMGIEDLFPQIQVFLSPQIVQSIGFGILSSAIWDGVKLFLCSLRKKMMKKPFACILKGEIDTNATPNIYVNIGKSHIVLPMDIDDKKFEYFVDKMFESINHDIVTEEKYVFYNAENQTLDYYSKHEVAMKLHKQRQESEENENKDN